MTWCEKEISKEIYDRSIPSGYIRGDDKNKVFTDAEYWGYGVYEAKVFEKDGKYFVRYALGDSCD